MKKAGFTLIELIIVIFIISLSSAIILPNLWDTGERSVKSEAKRLSSTLRYIYDEAVGKKMIYLMIINLDTDSWGFESENEARDFKLKDHVVFKDIAVPSLGEMTAGEITLKFGPLGPEEPVILHLQKNKADYTVIFNHINGRVKIQEGYKSLG